MLSLIISLVGAIGIWSILFINSSPWWGLVLGLAFLVLFHILVNLSLRKRIEGIFMEGQNQILAFQNRLTHKINLLQQRGCSDLRKLQELQENELREAMPQIIASYDRLAPYYKWSLLTERQVNTMKAQLYFQLHEYKAAEQLLKKSLALDSSIVAMKIVVAYRNKKTAEALKIAKKNSRRFKGDKAVIIYAIWSWILVKLDRIDEAIKVLVEGKDRTDNATLRNNWEHLVNQRKEKFSNAALGEIWFSMGLEQPKISRQKPPEYLRQKRR